MSTLDYAIQLATAAHKGQNDKAGHPYILHPLRVMLTMSGEVERIVAVLHDTIEDTELELEDIAFDGFAPEISAALDAITRREHEDYTVYINRLAANKTAKAVKIADLKDNLDPSRTIPDDANGPALRQRYRQALRVLSSAEDSP